MLSFPANSSSATLPRLAGAAQLESTWAHHRSENYARAELVRSTPRHAHREQEKEKERQRMRQMEQFQYWITQAAGVSAARCSSAGRAPTGAPGPGGKGPLLAARRRAQLDHEAGPEGRSGAGETATK